MSVPGKGPRLALVLAGIMAVASPAAAQWPVGRGGYWAKTSLY